MVYLQSNKYFERIIGCPLCSCESTNHNYTKRKAAREKTPHSKSSYSLEVWWIGQKPKLSNSAKW